MDPQSPLRVRPHDGPALYRLVRAAIRIGLRIVSPGLRLLNRERLERPGPAIIVITHPRSLHAALILISSLDRQVHCLLPTAELQGIFAKLAARILGMLAVDLGPEEQQRWLNPCLNALANQEAIALFAGHAPGKGASCAAVSDFAARLSMEAILKGPEHTYPAIYPVHCFLRTGRRKGAPLMCADTPLASRDFLPRVAEDLAAASHHLAEAVQSSIGANIFGLPDPELERFGEEMEGLSREYLREQWSQRPNWKQRPEDFELSTFARKWMADQNRTDPAQLVELRESVRAYREARRRFSLGGLMVETSGAWQASRPWVAAAWIETAAGFPVAVYGLTNHLPALIALRAGGLFRRSSERDPKVEWLWRIFIVLSSYTVQVFLVHFWWGRAVAGYYTLTLPVSGAYLWRYRWLVRRRIHLLAWKVLRSFNSARVARQRENILESFSQALERSAQTAAVPGGRPASLA
ncbi:MAG TPA: hypothetical protein VJW77_07365 [Terriglobia bacterium]|nr:hypothetical protein [Terriglobia bacterium]